MLKNTTNQYGWVSIVIHWTTALVVIAMFALGWWMLTLTYYDEWYRLGPWWHKSIGILLLALTLFRLLWKVAVGVPNPDGKRWEQKAAKLGHGALYFMLFVVMLSGYMISTADGRAISVFDWFDVPGISFGVENQEDIAGLVHWYAAVVLMILAAGHALMAVKHQVINKQPTLKKMISPNVVSKSVSNDKR
ncbi:cytochrome b [Idiomarina sp. OT37-5b]|jgi:cytochrome b561|uniref:Cytochrome b n=1 Tax=Idiomarina aquatica TaxID=1327752 RepID=A0AA94JDF1_9GAMM|nr:MULTISPECIES: cytochrome b [Idiomarina]AVJ57178.1 cytochrome b [Idiomarina sp. OT37-5b]RUO40421.1 cytochrome b [Idiomarina aquatica]